MLTKTHFNVYFDRVPLDPPHMNIHTVERCTHLHLSDLKTIALPFSATKITLQCKPLNHILDENLSFESKQLDQKICSASVL